jgi:hypothetical protein
MKPHTRLHGVITQNIFTIGKTSDLKKELSNTIAVARAAKRGMRLEMITGLHREWVRFGKAEINVKVPAYHPKPFCLGGHVKICILIWHSCLVGWDTV